MSASPPSARGVNLLHAERSGDVVTLIMNDPERRNALGSAMFAALEHALRALMNDEAARVIILRGDGRVFSAGFDLPSAIDDPPLLGEFIIRLSGLTRSLRRLPQVVIGCVHGAAIAGGCALVSACDIVVASRDAKLGYPVHAIGISPAVTIASLQQALPPGAARALALSGELLDAERAHATGLVTHLADDAESACRAAQQLAERIAQHCPHALRVTKQWINELDGSLDDHSFLAPAEASARAAVSSEAREMLAAFWRHRLQRLPSATA